MLAPRIAALALAVGLATGTGAGSARSSESQSPDLRKSTPASAADETMHGQLIWTWGDARTPGSSQSRLSVSLFTGDGAPIPLRVEDDVLERAGGYLSLKDRPVSVRGHFLDGKTGSARSPAVFQAEEITAATGDSLERPAGKTAAYALGDRRWLTILVRFADLADSTPAEPEYFRNLMDRDEAPSMTNYLREVSSGQLTLVDNVCVGWYTLPHPRSSYVFDFDGDGVLDLDFYALTIDSVSLADGEIDFSLFAGVNIAVNENLNNYAWGGIWPIQADGATREMGTTWLPDWAWANQSAVAHEMGHSLGLPHSSGPYSRVYDSRWDVMSSIWGNCEPRDQVFGCVAVDAIAFHRDLLGWIPSSRRFVARPSAFASIDLTPSGQPAPAGSYDFAVIPINLAAQRFYTVEVRRRHGYDGRLPGEGVIIHRVNFSDYARPARVVDATVDDNPNDEGAIWNAGERFEDAANGISVSIDEETESGVRVTIVRDGGNDVGCDPIDVPEKHWRGEYFSHFSGWGIPFAVEDRGPDALDVELDAESSVLDCGVPAKFFVSRWVRTLNTGEGEYLVRVETKRGIRLQIDRQILVDDLYVSSQERHFDRTVTLSRGTHVLRVESQVANVAGESLRVTVVRKSRDFRLDVESRYVRVRAEDAFDVDVQIDRFGSFKGPVTVRASGFRPAGISLVSSNRVSAGGDLARFRFKFKKNVQPRDATLTFSGVDKDGTVHTAVAYVMVEE